MNRTFGGMLLARAPVGLYIHIPFCETKCGYCDFYSVPLAGRETAPLVEGIVRELHFRLTARAYPVSTIFMGGGTPTILPSAILRDLLRTVGQLVDIGDVEEFTVEANPATVDDEKAALLVQHAVTRVSMGAQSFFASELAALERLHSPGDIAPSVQALRRQGVAQVNLDLIFGIPGQSLQTWSQSLDRAIDLGPDHIACYGLTYEPGTPLTAQRVAGRVIPCEESLEADLYLLAIDRLADAGYAQYEISNFARPGCECRHNLIYWRNQPYVGVGPSATGYVAGRRYKNVRDINGYIRRIDREGHAEGESEMIDDEKLILEMVMMQLRLNEGLNVADFTTRLGVSPLRLFAAGIARLTAGGLVEVRADKKAICLTRAGRLLADAVIAELVSAQRSYQSRPLPVLQ